MIRQSRGAYSILKKYPVVEVEHSQMIAENPQCHSMKVHFSLLENRM